MPIIKIKFGHLENGRKSIIQIVPQVKPMSARAPKNVQRGRLIRYTEVVEDNMYERTIFIKKKESLYKKMMTKLNKKLFTKPSGGGLRTFLNGIKQ